jgi:hypothetical protein
MGGSEGTIEYEKCPNLVGLLDTPLAASDNAEVAAPGDTLMTPAHRIETVLSEDGKLLLEHLPFRAGQTVEVIVLPATGSAPTARAAAGTVLRYDEPTAPVAEADWSALR